MQPSLLDNHHIGHVGGQGGGSRFPTRRAAALFPKFASLSPAEELETGSWGLQLPRHRWLPISGKRVKISLK